jgi:hypothetical protein
MWLASEKDPVKLEAARAKQAELDAKYERLRHAERNFMDACIREGHLKSWCEDRVEVMKRTGQ